MTFAEDLIVGLDTILGIAGIDATYKPKSGDAVPIRLLLKRQINREVMAAGSREAAEGMIKASDLSCKPAYGDLVELPSGEVFKVMRITEAVDGVGWKLELQANGVPNLAGGSRYD